MAVIGYCRTSSHWRPSRHHRNAPGMTMSNQDQPDQDFLTSWIRENVSPTFRIDYELLAAVAANPNLTLEKICALKHFPIERARGLVQSMAGAAFMTWLRCQPKDYLWSLQLVANYSASLETSSNDIPNE